MAHDEEDDLLDETLPPTRPVREPRLGGPPFWMVSLLIILLVASWLPLVFFAKARASTSEEPRVQFLQDMGKQPKYREQMSDEQFADGRADRMRIDGTVARGELQLDDHYYRGFKMVTDPATGQHKAIFFDSFPDQVHLTEDFIDRGQKRFNIYCAPCHGLDGSGNGLVNVRAHELKEALWVSPANLHDETVRSRPVGHIYNTINVGIRHMPGYGAQVPVDDRWAIVAYVRALQLSQHAPPAALSQDNQPPGP